MPSRRVKDLISLMDPDTYVYLFGLGKENLEGIYANIRSAYRDYEQISDSELDDELKQNEQTANLATSHAGPYAGLLSSIRLSERLQFSTLPQARMAGAAISGAGKVVGRILEEKAQLQHQYGEMARTTVQGVVAAGTLASRLPQALRLGKIAARAARTANNVRRGIMATRAVTRYLFGVGAASGVGAIPAIGLFLLTEAAGYMAYKVVEAWTEDRALRQAIKSSASEFADPSQAIKQFHNIMYTPVTDHEGLGRILDHQTSGGTASRHGYGYDEAASVMSILTRSGRMRNQDAVEFAATALSYGATLGSDVTDTFATLSRVRTDVEIETATEEFEKFFLALAADGKLHQSQATLVNHLAKFYESYGLGYKMYGNVDAISEIAGYIQPAYGNRQTIAPTVEVAQTIDQALLMGGSTGQNWEMRRLMSRSGMTRGEAFKGVTSSADTLFKFLDGMNQELGYSSDTFDEDGSFINDVDLVRMMRYFDRLGIGSGEISTLLPLVVKYVSEGRTSSGLTVEDVEEWMEEQSTTMTESEHGELLEPWIKGARALTDITLSYGDILVDISKGVLNLSVSLADKGVISKTSELISSAKNLLPEVEGLPDDALFWVTGIGGTKLTTAAGEAYDAATLRQYPGLASVNLAGGHEGVDIRIGEAGRPDVFYNPFPFGMQLVEEGTLAGRGNYANYENVRTGTIHQFSHLDSLPSQAFGYRIGTIVGPGGALGVEGTTGTSTNYHLDWRILYSAVTSDRAVKDMEVWQQVMERDYRGYSSGGAVSGGLASTEGKNLQNRTNYVNIEIEANGVDKGALASYLQARM